MEKVDYTILVGGAAGQGLDTFANIMEKIIKDADIMYLPTGIICQGSGEATILSK